jgi:two-component system cell cycle response regulator
MDPTAKTTTTTEGARVLVVDDDRHSLEIMSRMLAREGFQPLTASSGIECLATAQEQAVDVILLDVMMPEMDGFQVCAELRKFDRTRSIPVILLTAKDDVDTRVAGMKLGVSEFLTKPVNKKELFARIRSQLHAVAIRRELERTQRKLGTLAEP